MSPCFFLPLIESYCNSAPNLGRRNRGAFSEHTYSASIWDEVTNAPHRMSSIPTTDAPRSRPTFLPPTHTLKTTAFVKG